MMIAQLLRQLSHHMSAMAIKVAVSRAISMPWRSSAVSLELEVV